MSSAFLISFGIIVLLWRAFCVFPRPSTVRACRRTQSEPCSLAVFLGSGGHTSEALQLLSAIDFARYTPRTYFIGDGDELSTRKVIRLEDIKGANGQDNVTYFVCLESPFYSSDGIVQVQYRIVYIPRARRVHQSLLSTPISAAYALIRCLRTVTIASFVTGTTRFNYPEILLLNGPGTCFVLCIAVCVNRFLGLRAPKMIYVESFARVRSLSLSGRLLQHFVNRFIVQWPQNLRDQGRGDCYGCLV